MTEKGLDFDFCAATKGDGMPWLVISRGVRQHLSACKYIAAPPVFICPGAEENKWNPQLP